MRCFLPSSPPSGFRTRRPRTSCGASRTSSRRSSPRRLAAPFLAAGPSPRVPVLLRDLPGAVEFHRESVLGHGSPSVQELGLPAIPLPPAMLEEGLDGHMELLRGRVERALRVDPAAHRPALERQLAALGDGIREALAEKLPGESGARYARSESESLTKTWRMSLDLPFNCFLDAPLPDGRLAQVVAGLRASLEGMEPARLSPEDLSDPRRPEAAKAAALLRRVIDAAFAACAENYRELQPLDRRVAEWSERARAYVESEALRLQKGFDPARVPPKAAADLPPAPAQLRPSAAAAPRSAARDEAASPPSESWSRARAFAWFAAAGAAAWILWRLLRKPGS